MVCPLARGGGRSLKLKKVNYRELNAKQKELFNFQKLAAVMADYGFNCIRLSDDWQGADFLAYHKDGAETLKVQLKTRMTIKKEYIGKDLFLAFLVDGSWCLVEHAPWFPPSVGTPPGLHLNRGKLVAPTLVRNPVLQYGTRYRVTSLIRGH